MDNNSESTNTVFMSDSENSKDIHNDDNGNDNIGNNDDSNDNIFKYFNQKYAFIQIIQAKGNNIEVKDKQEVVILTQSLIDEIDDYYNKIGNKHKYFNRLLSMKSFLTHTLADLLDNSESLILLENLYGEIKNYLCTPELAYSGFLIINNLTTLKLKINENSIEHVKSILEDGQMIYKKLKMANKENNYYSGKELFSPDENLTTNKEVALKFEKLVVTNLLLLGSVYEKLGEHYKDSACYHNAFNKMLNNGLVSPFKWVDFTTRLACVFIDDNNFEDARHHLAAATHVHELLCVRNSTKDDQTLMRDMLQNNLIHISLAWVKYCVILFEKSKDEDRSKFAVVCKTKLLNCSKLNNDEKIPNNEYNIQRKINSNNIRTIDKEINEEDSGFRVLFNGLITGRRNVAFGDFDDETEESEQPKKSYNHYEKCNVKTDIDNSSVVSNVGKENDNITGIAENYKLTDEQTQTLKSIVTLPTECVGDINTSDNNTINKEIGDTITFETEKENESNGFEMRFLKLGFLPLEQEVTKDLIKTSCDAINLLNFSLEWIKKVETLYSKYDQFCSYVQMILNLVSLYRLCAYFQRQGNSHFLVGLEEKRENLLKSLLADLIKMHPESHLHVRLYQEIALLNADLVMKNLHNIYNIQTDSTYKLYALTEIQSHLSHISIVGDMLEKSAESIFTLKGHENEKYDNETNHNSTVEQL